MEKLPKREIHGQSPHILPCNKQSLNFFEGNTRKDEPPAPSMGAPGCTFPFDLLNSPMITLMILVYPVMRPPTGPPLSVPQHAPMEGSYRFPPQGPMILRGGPGGVVRPPMQMALGPRGPISGGPMVFGRMPGPPSQQHVIIMQQPQRPGLPPNMNGPPLVRQPIRPGAPGKK